MKRMMKFFVEVIKYLQKSTQPCEIDKKKGPIESAESERLREKIQNLLEIKYK